VAVAIVLDALRSSIYNQHLTYEALDFTPTKSAHLNNPVPSYAGLVKEKQKENRNLSMKLWRPLTFSLFMVILVLPAAATTRAGLGPYQPLSTIVIPPNSANGNVGALAGGFDISWFDFSTERFFIADRGTIPGAGQVDTTMSLYPTAEG
jgi:hypothetical protein